MHARFTFLIILLVLASLLSALHYAGLEERLYWKIWWYDILMHFLGGVVIAATYLWAVRFKLFERQPRYAGFSFAFLFVLSVGILWEIFELAVGLYDSELPIALRQLDTAQDILFDMLGGSAAYMAFSSMTKHG